MSTNPEEPQASPAPEHDFEELTGVYGFFRRHQKKLLYTAGLFTLLTFSITGPMTSLVSGVFSKDREHASVVINGQRVKLTSEDYAIGNKLARNYRGGVPFGMLLEVLAGEGGESELGEVFATMRRAAIAEGLKPSMTEVDKAIDTTRELRKLESAAKLAQASRFSSLAEYRQLAAEALRVGMYLRLQTLALNTSDAEVMRQVLLRREKITLKIATFDEKARQDEMKAAAELVDADLLKWLDEQSQSQKARMGAFDLPTVQLRIAALLTAVGQFDPSQWADGALKDFATAEDQLRSYYDADKDRFKVVGSGGEDTGGEKTGGEKAGDEKAGDEKAGDEKTGDENASDGAGGEGQDVEYKPFDDEEVQAELTRIMQAERVMNELNNKLKQLQLDQVEPKSKAVAEAQEALNTANKTLSMTQRDKMTKERELTAKEEELAKAPEDETLKAAVETLKAEVKAAVNAHFEAEQVVPQLQSVYEEAQKLEEKARVEFDFVGEFDKLVAGKSGFVHKTMDKQMTADEIKDLDALGFDLGMWDASISATSLREPGTISHGPGRTRKAVLIYQALANENSPLKPWDELKPLVEDAYWSAKAVVESAEKMKAINDALLRLAKEMIPEYVQEHESNRQSRIDTLVSDWETTVKADIAKATEMIQMPGLGTKPLNAWKNKLARKENELLTKEARVGMFGRQVDREIKNEIRDEAKKHYGTVLDAAAKEAGYTVTEVGPYPRNLVSRPRFSEDYDATVVYAFQHHSQLDAGESVGVVKDTEERRSHVISCIKVEPLTAADITRREFERHRKGFLRSQLRNAQMQAFTVDALTARLQLEKAAGVQVDPQ